MFDVTLIFSFFFFNDTATTEIYTLSLHDALPISFRDDEMRQIEDLAPTMPLRQADERVGTDDPQQRTARIFGADRKSTRLNSSHSQISYAVFCLKKKKRQ